MIEVRINELKTELNDLKNLRKKDMPQLYEKIMAELVKRCYNILKLNGAKYFIHAISENRTNIDMKDYIDINFTYYKSPNINLNLTKEEILLIKLLDDVNKQ